MRLSLALVVLALVGMASAAPAPVVAQVFSTQSSGGPAPASTGQTAIEQAPAGPDKAASSPLPGTGSSGVVSAGSGAPGNVPTASGPAVSAQAAFDWRPINKQTAMMLRGGASDDAEPIIRNALLNCPRAVNPLEAGLCTAIFSENLAHIQEGRGDLAGAETSFRRTLQFRAAVLPPADPLVGQAHLFLALFLHRHQRLAEEVTELQAAEAVAEQSGEGHSNLMADLLGRHGTALSDIGRYIDALPFFRDAYTIARDTTGPTSVDTLRALHNWFAQLIYAGFPAAGLDTVQAVLARPDTDSFDPTQRAYLTGLLAFNADTPARAKLALAAIRAALPDIDAGFITDPDAQFALLRGGVRLLAAEDPGQALALARQAQALVVQTGSKSVTAQADALASLADAQAALHTVDAAVDSLREAISRLNTPAQMIQRAEFEVRLAEILRQAGRRGPALDRLEALLNAPGLTASETPGRAATLALVGEELIRFASFDAAAKACGQVEVLALRPAGLRSDYLVKADLCLANAALGSRRANDALAAVDRAATRLWDAAARADLGDPALGPQITIADLRGRAAYVLGHNAEAINIYRERLALNRRAGDVDAEADALGEIGALQRLTGLNTEAEHSDAEALALLGPDGYPDRRSRLLQDHARDLDALGRTAEAVPLMRAALSLFYVEPALPPAVIASTEQTLGSELETLGRNTEAGRHLDAAIALYESLGDAWRTQQSTALDRRAIVARSSGDLRREESALRELLAIEAPKSDQAANIGIFLAGLLEQEARPEEAAQLRQNAQADLTAVHGADSAPVMRAELAAVPSMRLAGRVADVRALLDRCLQRASTLPELRIDCELAQGETALDEGAFRLASDLTAAAVHEAETRWSQNLNLLNRTLGMQARAAAALGDADGVLRIYDRIRALTPQRSEGEGWDDFGEGRALIEAGEPNLGQPMLRLAIEQAKQSHDAVLAVDTTATLAGTLLEAGEARQVVGLWDDVQPMVTEEAVGLRVTMLEGLGQAAEAMTRNRDAARFFAQAVSLAGAHIGVGSPVYGRLVLQLSDMQACYGDAAAAQDTLRLLATDHRPSAQRRLTSGLLQFALDEDDIVAANMHARTALAQTSAIYGPDSLMAASARLGLFETALVTDRHVDETAMEATIAAVRSQDPGWSTAFRIERARGLMALHLARYDEAGAAFSRAEALALGHEAPGSLDAAVSHADRARARLQAGDAEGADRMFREALLMAAPDGDWRNPVWARIAGGAVQAAEQVGDLKRAFQLRQDADRLIPAAGSRATYRWM